MRILLLNPPSPERLGSPLLGLEYVAAALLANGYEVRVIDAAARYFPHDAAWIVREAEDFAPDLIGVSLFTRWVWHAYELVEQLRGGPWTLVAGGAHTTVRPEETLRRGFDVALTGEAEHSLPRVAQWLCGDDDLGKIPGAVFRQPDGGTGYGPPAVYVENLDQLAPPYMAQGLFDAAWYMPPGVDSPGTPAPGGILTSRGCPARCTFCANHVTGRSFRHRSASNVTDEINAWHALTGLSYFPCWDDALTAQPTRLAALCEAIERDVTFPFSFGAITRANMVTRELLRTMRRAGLCHVNFGVESGDDEILRAIKKGIRTDQVVRALEWAKEEGLVTACNFMLGFPQETPVEVERTLRFMERIAPMVDSFSTMGVVVPFPGTPIYEDFHFTYGFKDWWLNPAYARYQEPPGIDDMDAFYRYYIDDTNLELGFFRYSPAMEQSIRECLRFKSEHNLRNMGLMPALGVR